MNENRLCREKERFADAAHMLYEQGLVVGSDGAMVWRISNQETLSTPDQATFRLIKTTDILQMSSSGGQEGSLSSDAATGLLMKILDQEKDIHSAIHAHSKYCSIVAMLRESPPLMMMPAFAQRVGSLRMVRYGPQWEEDVLKTLAEPRQTSGGILIEHLGAIAFGEDPLAAVLVLESLEHFMEIFYRCRFDEIRHESQRQPRRVEQNLSRVYLELTTRCDLSCSKCLRRTGTIPEDREMALEQVASLIRQIKEVGSCKEIVLFGYGEIFCHDRALEIIELLKSHGLDLTLITNGLRLHEKAIADGIVKAALDRLYVSFDDPDVFTLQAEQEESIPQRIRIGLARLRDARDNFGGSHPRTCISTVMTRSNLRQIRGIVSMSEELGVSEILISNLVPYDREMSSLSLINKRGGQVFRAKYDSPKVKVARMDYFGPRCCQFIDGGACFISAEGDMSPCPVAARSHREHILSADKKINQLVFGNIFKSSIREIWHSDPYRTFREKFEHFDFPDCFSCSAAEICRNRTEGEHDCFESEAPCADCLWSKGIVLCP